MIAPRALVGWQYSWLAVQLVDFWGGVVHWCQGTLLPLFLHCNLMYGISNTPNQIQRGEKPGERGGKVTCSATERPGATNVAVALSPPSFPSFFPPPPSLLLVPACFSPLPPRYLPAYKTYRRSILR